MRDLVLGENGVPKVWPYLQPTLVAAMGGLLIGLAVGGCVGLFLGSFKTAGAVLRPFLVVANSVPLITLIPILIVIFGTGLKQSILVGFVVVFFVTMFNSYEGARSVEVQMLENVQILGASRWQIMWSVRFPYAFAGALSVLPVSLSFSLVSVVTAEILTGSTGMGSLITGAMNTANSTKTFAVVVILTVCALVLLWISDRIKRRVLHWMPRS